MSRAADRGHDGSMLRGYLPALVFVVLGAGLGAAFAFANARLGPARRRAGSVTDPYECGLPSDFRHSMRFGVSFYLVAMLFVVFHIEVILLFPAAVVLRDLGLHGLIAVGVFIGLLGLALVYEWRRGALDWRTGG